MRDRVYCNWCGTPERKGDQCFGVCMVCMQPKNIGVSSMVFVNLVREVLGLDPIQFSRDAEKTKRTRGA